MFVTLLKHKLHTLKILPEEGQQLRPKHVAGLINKFVLHCAHACTLPRPCLKTLQRKNAPEEKNAPDVSLDATLFYAIRMLRLHKPCYLLCTHTSQRDSIALLRNPMRVGVVWRQ